MRVKALARRVLNQLRHDRRTMALMLMAPLLLLTLVYCILGDAHVRQQVAVISGSERYVRALEQANLAVVRLDEAEALAALERGEILAAVAVERNRAEIMVDGSDSAKAKEVLMVLENTRAEAVMPVDRPDLRPEVRYIYGYEDLSTFDNFGSVLIGFIIFFFVFLVAGISFLQERTSGTLEKLLSTPIRRWEIVAGYVLGFGLVTVLQSVLISWYCVYILDVMMVGSFALVLLITLLTAITALTLGILISTVANNAFQMIQFIPIVIIPQFFFAGMFDLTPTLAALGRVMPLYYVADALTEVMIKGNGLVNIAGDLLVLAGCSGLFVLINTRVLKKYRRI